MTGRTNKTGRPTKLTPAAAEKILTALRAGNFRKVAVAWAGVSQRSFSDWMLRGKKSPKSRHGTFRHQVIEAEKQAEMRMVALVMKAAQSDARHAEWWLERKFNSRWGRKEQVRAQLSDADGKPLSININLGGE